QAYRLVHLRHRDQRMIAAEAAFRAGEMFRTAGADERAREEFEVACERDPLPDPSRVRGADFGVRARLELGHLARRRGESLSASKNYEEVVTKFAAAPRRRAEAGYWYARMLIVEGDLETARRWFARVAQASAFDVDPLLRVRAFDFWARTFVCAGDVGGAVGVLELCRQELAPIMKERSVLGTRVTAALARMGARKLTCDLIRERHEEQAR
ncbi:MAG: hypothetical protein VCB43_07635, partial [Myxococcota bacterium]